MGCVPTNAYTNIKSKGNYKNKERFLRHKDN